MIRQTMALALLIGAPPLKDKPVAPPAANPLVGRWELVWCQNDETACTFEPGERFWTFTADGRRISETPSRTDPGRRQEFDCPVRADGTLDLGAGRLGDRAEFFCPGIYRVDEDTLLLCFNTEGKPRPATFDPPLPRSGSVLLVCRRVEHND